MGTALPWNPPDSTGAASWLDGAAPEPAATSQGPSTDWYRVSQLATKPDMSTESVVAAVRAEWLASSAAPVGVS
eukprot:2055706-Rhodomonas_salina.1